MCGPGERCQNHPERVPQPYIIPHQFPRFIRLLPGLSPTLETDPINLVSRDQRPTVAPDTIGTCSHPFKTTMSLLLPQEIIDLIIDLLRDELQVLRTCCLVSTMWVPRTQKYLFAKINLHSLHYRLSRWREIRPNPTSSPTHNIRSLSISRPVPIIAVDTYTLRTFRSVVHLRLDTDSVSDALVSLQLLHGFSPIITSLHLSFSHLQYSEIFDFICSFHLLEDLTLVSCATRGRQGAWNCPPTSPRLTGSLKLDLQDGLQSVTALLLDLPSGLRFKSVTVPWLGPEDITCTMKLVSSCSKTLEYLTITNFLSGMSPSVPMLDQNLTVRQGCRGTPRSISRKQRNSRMSYFGATIRMLYGSLRRSAPRNSITSNGSC